MNYFKKCLGTLLLSSALFLSLTAVAPTQPYASALEGEVEPLAVLGDDLYTEISMPDDLLTVGELTPGTVPVLTNGSFENAAGANVADGWTGRVTANSSIELISDPVDDGVKAQRLTTSGLPKLGLIFLTQQVAVEPNTQYTLSGNYRVTQLHNAVVQLYVDYFDAKGGFIKSASTTHSSRTEGYRQLNLVRVTPPNAASMKIYALLRASQPGGSGSFDIDRMELSKTDAVLDNPSFENYSSTSGMADHWQLLSPGGLPQTDVTTDAFAGDRAQVVGGEYINGGKYVLISQWLKVDPSTSYTVQGKFKIKELNNAKVQLYLDYYDAYESFLGMYFVEGTSITDGYIQLVNERVTPAKAAYARLYAVLRSTTDNASGHFLIDEMNFSKTADLLK